MINQKINIYGDIFNSSGYANHVKGLANGLYELGHDVCLITQNVQGWERLVSDSELNMITKEQHPEGIDIMIGLPQSWRMINSNRRNFIGFLVWEGDKVPKFWKRYLLDEKVKQIWVPSKHVKEAIQNTFVGKVGFVDIINKIKIVPHGVNQAIFYPIDSRQDNMRNNGDSTSDTTSMGNNKLDDVGYSKDLSRPADTFVFIANKGWRNNQDRGGLQFLIKAYCEEFTSKDDVNMIIKLNPAYGIPNAKVLIDELNITNQDKPNLSFITDYLDQKYLVKLYNKGNVFVSTTMAEAFNLGGLEAMSCGLPTLQTEYGGQIDYMTKDNSWKIEGINLVPVENDIMYEEIKWNKPSIIEIRQRLRYCYENRKEVIEKGIRALADSSKWTWLESAKKATKCIEELK